MLRRSSEMGKKGEGAEYKFMVVQPNGKWMQEISDLVQQVSNHDCMPSAFIARVCCVVLTSAQQVMPDLLEHCKCLVLMFAV